MWAVSTRRARTEICRLAHMSRGTFYELFETSFAARRYAFVAAYERNSFGPVPGAAGESGAWLEGLSSAIGVLFTGIAAEPLLAELCLVHSASAPEEARGHDSQAGIEAMTGLLCGGREAGREALRRALSRPSGAERGISRPGDRLGDGVAGRPGGGGDPAGPPRGDGDAGGALVPGSRAGGPGLSRDLKRHGAVNLSGQIPWASARSFERSRDGSS